MCVLFALLPLPESDKDTLTGVYINVYMYTVSVVDWVGVYSGMGYYNIVRDSSAKLSSTRGYWRTNYPRKQTKSKSTQTAVSAKYPDTVA